MEKGEPHATEDKELESLRESKDDITAKTSVQKQVCSEEGVTEDGEAESDTLVEQHDAPKCCEVKTEKSGEQGQGDAEENVEASEDIKPGPTNDQHTPSRL